MDERDGQWKLPGRGVLPACMVLLIACGATSSGAPPPPKDVTEKASANASPRPPASAPLRGATLPEGAPPPAKRQPVVHTYFGTEVRDDYEWLEDPKSPEVRSFVDAENAYARRVLDSIAGRSALHARLEALMGTPRSAYLSIRRARNAEGFFVLESRPPKQQPVLVFQKEMGGAKRVIVDPNTLDASASTTIDFFVPSPNGKLVAVSLSKGGTESGDVHVFEVASRAGAAAEAKEAKETGDVTSRVNGGTAGGSLTWNTDGTGYFYTRYPHEGERPEADLDFYQQVYFHKLGTPESKDTYSIGKEFPRIAEVELDTSGDGQYLLAKVALGDGGAFEHHVSQKGGASGASTSWKRLSSFGDELSNAVFGPKDKLYVLSRKGAPRGKVVAFSPPFDGPPETVIEEGDAVIEEMVVTSSALYLVELTGGPSRVRRVPLDAKPEPLARAVETKSSGSRSKSSKKRTSTPPSPPPAPVVIPIGGRGLAAAEVPIPPISNVMSVERMGDDVLFKIGSYLAPPSWFRYVAREHRLVPTEWSETSPADMSDVEVVREKAKSKDGTMVPMTILRKKGVAAVGNGNTPTLLTAYGGYGVSLKPRFRAWYRAWLDAGGAVVEANLRGGGEMGEAWHRQGSLTNKQNVFDDFYACAQRLVSLGITNPEKLAITGRSNGGLLMGAALVQHPEMFRAVVSGVGIYDMLRSELSPNGAFNVTEFGTVTDEAQFRAMFAYSPFHNVKDGVAYPAVLLTTGANDPRVDPYQSRKMTARLRAATASGKPILLRASLGTGHGMGSPLSEVIDETTDMLAFLFRELGM